MRSSYYSLKPRVIELRKQAKTYGEIRKFLNKPIPKSTLSDWCRNISLPKEYGERLERIIIENAEKGRAYALAINKLRREKYIQSVKQRVSHLSTSLYKKDTAKIALAMLFLGEGSKKANGSVMFGNSDPRVVKLYLRLLRHCYSIDENKFRCTLQCRADQDIKRLEKFWSQITNISLRQFYRAQIDPRTIGKPSKNLDYKGVCRIDYFSAEILMDLKQVIEVIFEGL